MSVSERKCQLCPKCGFLNTPLRRNRVPSLSSRVVVVESVVYPVLVLLGVVIVGLGQLLLLFPLALAFFVVERVFRRFRWKLPADKKDLDKKGMAGASRRSTRDEPR